MTPPKKIDIVLCKEMMVVMKRERECENDRWTSTESGDESNGDDDNENNNRAQGESEKTFDKYRK